MAASGALAVEPAEPAAARDDPHALPTINVTARNVPFDPLTQPLETGSRLGLASLDTPASVETVTADAIEARGDRTVLDAVTRATGFTNAAAPGNGGTALSVRGFGGQESVMTLLDGVRLLPAAGTITFPFDTWSVDRIEVLRGPASVLYGEGAIGGVVNVVPKRPQRTRETTLQAGIGADGAKRVAFDTTGALGPRLSYRFYVSDARANGLAERADTHTTAFGGALKFDVSPRLTLTLDYDYGRQMPATYFGVPAPNGVLDSTLRKVNYNVGDATITYYDQWTRLSATYRPAAGVTIDNQFYYLTSNRHWRNAEAYALDAATGRVTRGDYLELHHHQRQVGDRLSARVDGQLFGRANRFVVGTEFNQITFEGINNSPYGGESTVNAHGFDPGAFTSPDPTVPQFRTRTRQAAVFAENRLEVLPRVAWVSGLRYDHIAYHREQAATGAGFDKHFAHLGWRTGFVYEIAPTLTAYAQYTTGAEGLGSLVTLSASQANFRLATGEQWEAGVKQTLFDGRAYWTFAVYDITKRNLLSTDPFNPALRQQVGRQSSRGVELTGGARLPRGVTVDANVALLRARYDAFDQTVGGVAHSRAGNVPSNVPQQTANLWLGWAFAERWQANAGVRYVGPTYGDDANRVSIPSYTVFDASLRWQATSRTDFALYLRNLANRTYAVTTSNGGEQWLLGPSRAAELVATMRF
ncbi:TonB-dependent receptor [Burkholderia stagnalis]|uniref:TonB-dependent receptor n=2 Tax=Burkholderia stagnalis TaxID=1503054 RepID=A0A108A1X0_9BURK|nr:TonB-dependent receptor [Burkholderia stagnalis]KWA46109.1 TonB-dependent receptor [Burkholderia stagnalis]KWA52527.1 TonB-dependent receptor [Burkholderia stagnalis]KWA62128.1 TonB-dependent receptor [Burkholderia stagnalis]KWC90851.1 TonB-dependent receptor [Burkholderia stagnalis]